MTKHILAVNTGSSSLKIELSEYNGSNLQAYCCLAACTVAGLNGEAAKAIYKIGKDNQVFTSSLSGGQSLEETFDHVVNGICERVRLPALMQSEAPRRHEDLLIAHRIVHGGSLESSVEISEQTLPDLDRQTSLAPIHNAPAMSIVKHCLKRLQKARNLAMFDTVFHASMAEAVKSYAINRRIAKPKGLRKYGFHGISYQYTLRKVSEHLKQASAHTNLIVLHFGSGASVCAIQDGKSIDTTMGLTPVAGIPGSSRCGDIDPALIFHYMADVSRPVEVSGGNHADISTAEKIMNKESGWASVAGTSDFSEIASPDAKGYVGNYFVKLQGRVDAIVFSGGIGENSAFARSEITKKLGCLGVKALAATKCQPVTVSELSTKGLRVLVCKIDEEEEMAHQLCNLLAD